jgi:hypothetical protein
LIEFEIEDQERERKLGKLSITQQKEKADKLRPNFGWLSAKRTLCVLAAATTQHH